MKKALVLSGGGARGGAHVGVIKALEEIGFIPDMIVGVSMGATVGAGYAVLKDSEKLWEYSEMVYKKSRKPVVELGEILSGNFPGILKYLGCLYMLNKKSVFSKKAYFKIFERIFANYRFEDLQIEFYCISADLMTGELVIHSSGKLSTALIASMAIPGLFPPVEIDGRKLVDGGTLNNLPCSVAKNLGAEYIVAVDLSADSGNIPKRTSSEVMLFVNSLKNQKVLEKERNLANILLRPPVAHIGSLSFNRSLEAMKLGYEYAKNFLTKSLFAGCSDEKDHTQGHS